MFIKKISPNLQIFFAIISSIAFAVGYVRAHLSYTYLEDSLTFIGDNFIRGLQLLAVPLVLFSIIHSMYSIKDTSQLSRIGLFVFILYLGTTFFAVCLGLLLGNVLQPGNVFRHFVSPESLNRLKPNQSIEELAKNAEGTELLPDNFFALLSDNGNLLYVVIFGMAFGFALMKSGKNKKMIFEACEGIQEALTKVMSYIMRLAPLGIFCLVASRLVLTLKNQAEDQGIQGIFVGLMSYVGMVFLGFGVMLFIIYPLILKLFSNVGYRQFVTAMRPAQLLAFSTSSSTATLHKTNEQTAKLNVSEKVRSFVLSLGATVNMDGTAIYQGLTMAFITQLFDHELSLYEQIYVAGYVTLSSIGVAGIPGASLVTTSILLNKLMGMGLLTAGQVGLAMALIHIPDRLLDMGRTTVNITSDAAVAVLVQGNKSKQEL